MGRWIEIARYPQTTQQGQCNRAEYTFGNNVISLTNSQVLNQRLNSVRGTAVVKSTDGSGLLEVTIVRTSGKFTMAYRIELIKNAPELKMGTNQNITCDSRHNLPGVYSHGSSHRN